MSEEKKSNYYGYLGDTPQQRFNAAKGVFDANYEGAKKDYLRGKSKEDPSIEDMSNRLGQGDEEAAGILQKAHNRADKRRDEVFKLKRDLGIKKAKGGMVSSASKRADGCCVKGKTKGKMV